MSGRIDRRLPAALALAGSDATDVDCDPGANPFDLAPFMGFESAEQHGPGVGDLG